MIELNRESMAMTGTISASEANRNFSAMLRRVQQGDTLVITTHGRPVARVSPYGVEDDAGEDAEKIKAELIARWRERPLAHLGKFTRDQAYDDAE